MDHPGVRRDNLISEIDNYKGLLKTKIRKPKINSHIVKRQRLSVQLDKALSYKVAIVSAPAGFGKSTAVLDWLESRQLSSAWISLDTNDNDPQTFWKYVCSSLGMIDASIPEETSYIFSSFELFKTNIFINVILDKFIESESEIVLVFDDAHLITNKNILDTLSYFISYFPNNLHLILICRSVPELALAHLEVNEQLTKITAEDLRFQPDEICDFFTNRGIILNELMLDSIRSYSEGWAATLVGMALTLEYDIHQQNKPRILSDKWINLDQYLLDEVFRTSTKEMQEFFLHTSCLDIFCADLCDAVNDMASSATLLDQLQKNKGFLISLDDNSGWFRYHHILKDFLYNHLIETSPQLLPSLHKRAANWLLGNGYSNNAIDHYLTGNHYEDALKLIEEKCISIIDSGDFFTALNWIRRLPDSIANNSLQIAAIKSTYFAVTGQFELSNQWTDKMECIAKSEKYATGPAEKFARNACSLIKAHNRILRGDIFGIENFLSDVIQNDGLHNNLIHQYLNFNHYDIYFYRCPSNVLLETYHKNPDLYREILGKYQSLIGKSPGYASLIAGESLYESNRLEESMDHMLIAVDKAKDAKCPGVLIPSMVTIARINMAYHNPDGAFAAIHECESRLKEFNVVHWKYLLKAFETRLFLEVGQNQEALHWFESCGLNIYQEITRAREFELLVYARVLISMNRTADAEILLKRMLTYSTELNRKHSVVEVLNLLVVAIDHKGYSEKVRNYLKSSLEIGLSEGYLRSYLDEGESLANLLRKSNFTEKNLKDFVQNILRCMAQTQRSNETKNVNGSSDVSGLLTRQEQRVLQLLASGKTNKQISDHLNISLSTTKIHLGNIYGKLQVSTRVQCLNQARDIGLIS